MKNIGFSNFKSGLLGEKLAHSFSPQIHNCLSDYSYNFFEKTPEDVENFLKNGEYDAINVTIPYKKVAFSACDNLSDIASKVGSVNTVVKKNGMLSGYNTDYFGFTYLIKKAGFDVKSGKALVLGSGGSSVMAVAALKDLGSPNVIVISRSGENNYNNIYERHSDAKFIINTTPMGMYPNNGVSAVELNKFRSCCGVIDIIFNPAKTKLLLDAENLGIPYINGLPMLVAQAKQASDIFLGKISKDGYHEDYISKVADEINDITKIIELETKSIALIGMPGCGKSTIGAILAKKLSKAFVDIDLEIEKIIGTSIPEFFASKGEAEFRKIETATLDEYSRQSGIIIATGGGVIKNPKNLPVLKQNSLIVMIKRPVSSLATEGRPISLSTNLEQLAKERLPIYESWKDICVDTENSCPDAIADEIIQYLSK